MSRCCGAGDGGMGVRGCADDGGGELGASAQGWDRPGDGVGMEGL
jgi:hypothetical protein